MQPHGDNFRPRRLRRAAAAMMSPFMHPVAGRESALKGYLKDAAAIVFDRHREPGYVLTYSSLLGLLKIICNQIFVNVNFPMQRDSIFSKRLPFNTCRIVLI